MGWAPRMLHSKFISHLARKGVLRDGEAIDAAPHARRRDGTDDCDWIALTKLTQSAFADELAAFYDCDRVERRDLVGSRFAGAELSPRFLKEQRLFPYEDRSGTLVLAIARPIDEETVHAAEIALRQQVAIAVATAEDIETALAKTLAETPAADTAGAAETPDAQTSDDTLDDLRDLAR